MMVPGQEIIAPRVRPDACGNPYFRLPSRADRPVPFLGYAPGELSGETGRPVAQHDQAISTVSTKPRGRKPQGHGARGPWNCRPPPQRRYREVRAKTLVGALPEDAESAGKPVEVRLYPNRHREGGIVSRRSDQGDVGSSRPATGCSNALRCAASRKRSCAPGM